MTQTVEDKSPSPPRLWRAERLTVERGARPVLRDVDLTIAADDTVALIGPNGSGKTTLMLALLGLLPATGGRVCVDDVEIGRLSPRRRAQLAAYVPQVVERLPGFRVWDVAAGGRYPHASSWRPLTRRDEQAVDAALTQCGLSELAERPVTQLSGGERQKVLLAAAVAQDADMLFLDEPNTALDPAYQVELVRLLRRWRDSGRGVVLISHDLHLPAALGGRAIALRDGAVVADASVDEVLQVERLAEIYAAPFETAQTADGRRVLMPRW